MVLFDFVYRMAVNLENPEDTLRIPEFFEDKAIFITGGSGFLGKVIIEKLLRCCPDLRKIFVLIRGKRGLSGVQRIESICQQRVR